jgi:HK97 family phage prohead protease
MLEHKDFKLDIKGIDEEGVFSGYASTFGNEDLGGDIVQKGAFTKTLTKGADSVLMFYQHDSAEIIGEFTELKEDDKGLFFKGRLFINDIKRAQETHFLMKKNKLKAVSIGYRIEAKGHDSEGRRLLKQIDLKEISVVTFPMNEMATIDSVKSVEEMTEREFEKSLRDVADLSKTQAKALMSGGYSAMLDLTRDVSKSERKQEGSDLSELLSYLREL